MVRHIVIALLAVATASTIVSAQSQNTSAQALTLASQSMAALTRGTPIGDITLTGQVISIAGSDKQVGTGTFRAKGFLESRVDLVLSDENWSDIMTSSSGLPAGYWIASDGAPHAYALHNCWTNASWFFPPLMSYAAGANSQVTLSYIGAETRAGNSVYHLRSSVQTPWSQVAQQLSTTDYYLDSTSLLPIAITFNVHPDGDALTDIPVEVDFNNYQLASGVLVPFHIQKLVQGSLVLDLTVTSVSLNSGLPDTVFNIQ